MNQCPIQAVKAATPWWMNEILRFDGLEVHPVRQWIENGQSYCEVCVPEDAHFWSVYGRLKEDGRLMCFSDFDTQAEAEADKTMLLKVYPHLREEA